MFLCSFWVLVTIYRMYIMIMCSAQRNKRVKRKTFEAFMWTIMFFFCSLEGSIGQRQIQHRKREQTWNTKPDKTWKMMCKTDTSHGYRARCGLSVASFDISYFYFLLTVPLWQTPKSPPEWNGDVKPSRFNMSFDNHTVELVFKRVPSRCPVGQLSCSQQNLVIFLAV